MLGDRSTPTFADVDGDGDLDLIVGESGGTLKYYENVDNALHYYEGTDFFIGAVYVEDSGMFSGIDVGAYSDPAFADLDGDGDEDLTIGESGGSLEYYRNDGGGIWTYDASMYSGMSVSGYSTPAFADMDGDDDFDLTVGAGGGGDAGKFAYYRNDGGTSSPSWTEDTGYYSGVDVGDRSNPALADMDDDGDIDLTSGESLGTVKYYRNDAGTWVEDTAPYSSIDVGDYSAPALADLDFNLCYDLTVGASNGLLYYYENKGTAASYDKLIWSNIGTGFGMDYYYDETVYLKHRGNTATEDFYADIINNAADPLWYDEIAFSIAHTGTSTLRNSDVKTYNAFEENAEYIYINDQYLDYVEIVEKPDYTTLSYWVNDTGSIFQVEISRDMYYQFVVHPKVEDEIPCFINPNGSGAGYGVPAAPPTGQFWREMLFHNAWGEDPDQPGIPRPVLKDRLAGIGTFWNCTKNKKTENGAIGVITQWVQDSLDFNSGGERPHQPVRIYGILMGRCGEHADFTTAAARASLIPTININQYAEDHTWNEFWERGWHEWEPVNTYIDRFYAYTYGWNKDMSAVWGQRGDTYVLGNKTELYIRPDDYVDGGGHYEGHRDSAIVTVTLTDANGNPVDGAKVAISSWWTYYYFVTWIVGDSGTIWNYTNPNGEVSFVIGESRQREKGSSGDISYNEGITIHIDSKYGGGIVNPTADFDDRYRISFDTPDWDDGTYIHYNYSYQLGKAIPRSDPPAIESTPSPGVTYKMECNYEVESGGQFPAHAGHDDCGKNFHSHDRKEGNHVDSFVVSSANLTKFLKGYEFDCHNLSKNSSSDNIVFEIPDADNWHYILSNQDTLETTKVVNITMNLYEIGGDISVDAPTNIDAGLEGAGLEDVNITWTLSKDDGGGENDVVGYDIYYNQTYTGEDYNKSKTYTKISFVSAGVSYFVHENDGLNTTDSFYYVVVKDGSGNTDATVDQAGKIVKECVLGWNFISDPYLGLDGTDITTVLQTLEWDTARWYDPLDTEDHWVSYSTSKSSGFNDFTDMNRTMGIWVNVTIGGDHFVDTGRVHESTAIQLYKGWNLVSYASFTDRTVEDALSGIWSDVEKVEGFDENNAPYYLKNLAASDWMEAGCGYWIYTKENCIWTIEN
jgi:hypothetical protein